MHFRDRCDHVYFRIHLVTQSSCFAMTSTGGIVVLLLICSRMTILHCQLLSLLSFRLSNMPGVSPFWKDFYATAKRRRNHSEMTAKVRRNDGEMTAKRRRNDGEINAQLRRKDGEMTAKQRRYGQMTAKRRRSDGKNQCHIRWKL